MALGVEQTAIVMLAVNLDRHAGDIAQHRRRNCGTTGKGAAPAISLERPP